jgi:predicted nucleic acid-binding protein
MPIAASREEAELLVDTSVAVALLVADHDHHDATFDAVGSRRLGLAGHAAFETFSVLTRLPSPARRRPMVVSTLLERNFPATRFLPADASEMLLGQVAGLGISGGAVYDALVGAVAAHHRVPLASRDRRAADTYRRLEVDLEMIG